MLPWADTDEFQNNIGVSNINKKLSCRRETVRRFVSLNILLSHSRSFEMTLLSRTCLLPPKAISKTEAILRR